MTENSKPDWDGAMIVRDADGGRWYLLSDGTYGFARSHGVDGYAAFELEAWFGPCEVVEDGRPDAKPAPGWDGAKIIRDRHGSRWHLLSDGTYGWSESVGGGGCYAYEVEDEYGPCGIVEDGRIEKGSKVTENTKPDWDGAKIVHDADGALWYLLSCGTYGGGRSEGFGGLRAYEVEDKCGPCVVVEDGRPATDAAEGDALREFVKGLVAGDVVRATYTQHGYEATIEPIGLHENGWKALLAGPFVVRFSNGGPGDLLSRVEVVERAPREPEWAQDEVIVAAIFAGKPRALRRQEDGTYSATLQSGPKGPWRVDELKDVRRLRPETIADLLGEDA